MWSSYRFLSRPCQGETGTKGLKWRGVIRLDRAPQQPPGAWAAARPIPPQIPPGLYLGYVPGFPGAHAQADSLDTLNRNLREVIEMPLEDGEPTLDEEGIAV
jgi:hypothetical protein